MKYGIGLHVTGYELIEGTYIPELFLISNYANTAYVELRELSYSRETFHSITGSPPEERHRDPECRKVVHEYLINGDLIIYNNGDPNLFNPVFNAIFDTYRHSKRLDKVREIETLHDLISLIRRPIEVVAKFQSDFFKVDKILVGQKVHDLAVWRDQRYYSTSGD